MTYRPRRISNAATILSGRKVDGVATTLLSGIFSTMNTGATFESVVLGADPTACIRTTGGCLRSNSTYIPFNARGSDTGTFSQWHLHTTLDSGTTPRIRISVGTSFTGTGNVLSSGVVILEFIP